MQINGYNSDFNLYNLKLQNTVKPSKNSESEVSETTQAKESQKLTEAEEMNAFKKEIYGEIAKINAEPPSYQLSMSISITDKAFEKMKNDPNFRAEVMNTLKENAQPNPQMASMPFDTRVTTTVKEDGVYSYGANVYDDDSPEVKDNKKNEAETKAAGAFYFKSNDKSDVSLKQINMEDILLENEQNQELYEMARQTEDLLRQLQQKNVSKNGSIL